MLFCSLEDKDHKKSKLRLASQKYPLIIRIPKRRKDVYEATLAQLVERNLAKVEVTSSNLVCRSKLKIMAKAVITDGV